MQRLECGSDRQEAWTRIMKRKAPRGGCRGSRKKDKNAGSPYSVSDPFQRIPPQFSAPPRSAVSAQVCATTGHGCTPSRRCAKNQKIHCRAHRGHREKNMKEKHCSAFSVFSLSSVGPVVDRFAWHYLASTNLTRPRQLPAARRPPRRNPLPR